VAAAAAFAAQAERPGGKVEIVVNDQQQRRLDFVKANERPDGPAALVHPRLRLGQHHARIADASRGDERLVLHSSETVAVPFCQPRHNLKADVVAGEGILAAGVAQPHDERYLAGGRFFSFRQEPGDQRLHGFAIQAQKAKRETQAVSRFLTLAKVIMALARRLFGPFARVAEQLERFERRTWPQLLGGVWVRIWRNTHRAICRPPQTMPQTKKIRNAYSTPLQKADLIRPG